MPYSDFIERLFLTPGTLSRLFPSDPREISRILQIREVQDGALMGDELPHDPSLVLILRSLLFYFFDALDDARWAIQSVEGDHAAYVRAMIHRRMGDMQSTKDLYARAGLHPAFHGMHRAAAQRSPQMAKQFNWDPYMFTLMCEQYKFGAQEEESELLFLQKIEFEHIFDYTWRQLQPR